MTDDPRKKPGDDVALTIVQNGQRREITVRELTVGNKVAADALLSLLIEKGVLTAQEFQERVQQLSSAHFRPGDPSDPEPGEPN